MNSLKTKFSQAGGEEKVREIHSSCPERKQTSTMGYGMWPLVAENGPLLIRRNLSPLATEKWILPTTWMIWEKDSSTSMWECSLASTFNSALWDSEQSPATLYSDFWSTECQAKKLEFFTATNFVVNLLWSNKNYYRGKYSYPPSAS